jgi:hypothetical protein
MRANVPPPRFQVLQWPQLTPAHSLTLAQIAAERRQALCAQLPAAASTAWQTATDLLVWVSTRWAHAATSHTDGDALQILEMAAGGARFACREYTTLLSQSLNARGIPARSVVLLTPDHHCGIGRGHAVTEAWIDDLAAWVVLDGQNGMYWADHKGEPLGLVELHRRQRCAAAAPAVISAAGKASADAVGLWWPHFHTVAPTGLAISPAPFAPMVEGNLVLACGMLLDSASATHPDLLELGIGITDLNGVPAIQPVTRHPHARGFQFSVEGRSWRLAINQAWPLSEAPQGECVASVATITDYLSSQPQLLRLSHRPLASQR